MTAISSVGYQRCRGFVYRDFGFGDGDLGNQNNLVAGRLPKESGKKVVLVADVLTTGKVLRDIAEFISKEHEILTIIPLLDRLEELGVEDELGKYRELVNPILVTADFGDMADEA